MCMFEKFLQCIFCKIPNKYCFGFMCSLLSSWVLLILRSLFSSCFIRKSQSRLFLPSKWRCQCDTQLFSDGNTCGEDWMWWSIESSQIKHFGFWARSASSFWKTDFMVAPIKIYCGSKLKAIFIETRIYTKHYIQLLLSCWVDGSSSSSHWTIANKQTKIHCFHRYNKKMLSTKLQALS